MPTIFLFLGACIAWAGAVMSITLVSYGTLKFFRVNGAGAVALGLFLMLGGALCGYIAWGVLQGPAY